MTDRITRRARGWPDKQWENMAKRSWNEARRRAGEARRRPGEIIRVIGKKEEK